ncbi:glycosyl transferase family 41-domain-containing protein, partial [Baffinella frigidus]
SLGRQDEALKSYKEATKVNPTLAAAWTNMGTIYQARYPARRSLEAASSGKKQNEEARHALEEAVKHDPNLAEAYTNLGIALQDLGETELAVNATRTAVELKPSLGAAHNNYGRALENANDLEGALGAYREALKQSGQGYAEAFCAQVYLKHFLCDWNKLDADMEAVSGHLAANLAPHLISTEPCVQPFRAFAYPLDPILFLNIVAQERLRVPAESIFRLRSDRVLDPMKPRLRIGYMSSDFGGHTVGSLIRNILRIHNRNRVSVVGIGMMKGDGTEWNLEMERSTDEWLSIHGMGDHAAAFAVDALEVHILVDLNGHSKGARVGVLLRRPAPVIISYLGYPSTSGDMSDSIVTDRWASPPETHALYTEKLLYLPHSWASPPETHALYTEKLLYLPHSYFVNDHRQLYPRPFVHTPKREEHGLPVDVTLFGNFGQLYKVDPQLFGVCL